MNELSIAMLGDVVGAPGRLAVEHAVAHLKTKRGVSLVIANGENARHGSGITADNARELWKAGVHGITLGDHVYKDRAIIPLLEDDRSPIARPANLALTAPGKRVLRLSARTPNNDLVGPPICVITVLGRLFMPMPADNPFAAVDREILALPDKTSLVIVEVHGEATSEKIAMSWHCLDKWTSGDGPRVIAVVGSHTHVQTADARIIDHRLAAITDLGMSGPHRGVIGRSAPAVLRAMIDQSPTPLDVASDDIRATGILLRVDTINRRAVAAEALDIQAK